MLPDGCADIVWIDGEGIVVAGPATREVLVDIPAGAAALGVRFGPGAAGAALGVAAHELRDRTVALEDVWGAPATRAGRAPGRRAARRTASRCSPPPSRGASTARARPTRSSTRASALLAARHAGDARRAARSRSPIATCAAASTTPSATAPRRCSACCACAASWPSPSPGASADLARVAAEAGYADQPHLTRECAELAGLPPAALLAARAAA